MRVLLIDLWLRIRASYWFVPSLMVAAAIGASATLVSLEPAARALLGDRLPVLFASEPPGMQALLSTIAGSMITVAGVTFSMTLLAVSHATAQIGPGLLTGFMRDRGNQVTLGTFVATFVYCLLVLRTVNDTDAAGPGAVMIPQLATIGAIVLAFVSVGVLIYFFHHVPQSINVVRLIASVGDDLVAGIGNMYPADVGEPTADAGADGARKPADEGLDVPAGCDGYLRVVDGERLLELACEHDLVIRVLARPGDYLLPTQPLIGVAGSQPDDATRTALLECFSFGFDRTVEQDVLLPAEQLLEIMGKALSPGINNQKSAIHCIDQLFRGMAEILGRREPDRVRSDDDGRIRIIAAALSHEQFIRAVLRPMRQYVAGDWIATHHLLKRLGTLLALESATRHHDLIRAERDAIRREAQSSVMPEGLRDAI